ncbi:MAG: flagellar motor switch protein FliN [Phycisphaerales bacterium]
MPDEDLNNPDTPLGDDTPLDDDAPLGDDADLGDPPPLSDGAGDRDASDALEEAARSAQETAAAAADATRGGNDDAEGAQPFAMPDFGAGQQSGSIHDIDLLSDVSLTVRIELGRSRMLVEDVLRLDSGAVVELDKLAGDPVDVYVNNRYVARGEVLVLNDNFCVRINEILSREDDERSVG